MTEILRRIEELAEDAAILHHQGETKQVQDYLDEMLIAIEDAKEVLDSE